MPFIRYGRPGLLGTIARTAVIAGTASVTASAINRRTAEQAEEQQELAADANQQREAPETKAAVQSAEADAAAAQREADRYATFSSPSATDPSQPVTDDDLVSRLRELGKLRDSGVLDPEEFAAAKSKLLIS